MENNMNYPVLKIFDIVELRDGRLAVVLPISEKLSYLSAGPGNAKNLKK